MTIDAEELDASSAVDVLIRERDTLARAAEADQRTIDSLIRQRDEMQTECDRWIERNRILEERLAEIRKIAK